MIGNATRTILSSAQSLIYKAEENIRVAAKNKVQEEVLKVIPTPADLQKVLGSLNPHNLNQLGKAQNQYNRLRNICDSQISKLNSFKQQINQITAKLDIIESLFEKLQAILEVIEPIIPILKFTIPVISNAIIAAQVGTISSGTLMDKAQSIRDIAKSKIIDFEGSIGFFNERSKEILKQSSDMKSSINKALDNLNKVIAVVEELCRQLEKIYKAWLEQLDFSDQIDLEDAGIFNPTDSTDDISDILDNLNNTTRQKYFVELGNQLSTKTGYKFKIVSGSAV